MTVRADVVEVAARIRANLTPEKAPQLRAILSEQHPADLADAMLFLNEKEDALVFETLTVPEAAEALDEVDASTEARLVRATRSERLAAILGEMPADKGAAVVGAMPGKRSGARAGAPGRGSGA